MRRIWKTPTDYLANAIKIEGQAPKDMISKWSWINEKGMMGIPQKLYFHEFLYIGKVKFTKTIFINKVSWADFNTAYSTYVIRQALKILRARVVHLYVWLGNHGRSPYLLFRRGRKLMMIGCVDYNSDYQDLSTLWESIPDGYKMGRMLSLLKKYEGKKQ